jgi:hypothetical protein
MFSMAHRIMGDTSGSMAADFLNVLSQINHTSFKYRSLSMGDTVNIGSSQYEILWPPKIIDDESTLNVISKAINDFNTAVEGDETLRRILETIGKKGKVRTYSTEERETGELPGCGKNVNELNERPHQNEKRELPEMVRKANESLRAAANHLSLAFHEDNKFLFLGDLEGHEIKQVVKILTQKHRHQFFVTVTPHHGTHWDSHLGRIHTCYSVSSVGSGLFRHLSPKFKSISDICLITHLNGDVEIPVFFPTWYGPRPLRNWHTFF